MSRLTICGVWGRTPTNIVAACGRVEPTLGSSQAWTFQAATRGKMYGNGSSGASLRRKITAPDLRARKVSAGAPAIVMVTAYDFTMARLMDEGGADAILVGDSLG